MSGSASDTGPPSPPDDDHGDDLVLTVKGKRFTGWQSVRVTRGIDHMPSDFELGVTEAEPGNLFEIFPFDDCTVAIGSDLVLTGYVDRYASSISRGSHPVTITGRGKCQDLVDCAAVYPGAQIKAGSVRQLAQDLGKAYGITATGEAGPPIPQFNLNLGETSWEIIERCTRYGKLLAYEGTDGNLILATVGKETHTSGFAQGANIQDASCTYSGDQRFSEYKAAMMTTDRLQEIPGGNLLGTVKDEGVPRFRLRVIISEQTQDGVQIALARAQWEKTRRYGRSQTITLTCDSWRDSAGRLWSPNTLALVEIPALKRALVPWLISEVVFMRDGKSGRTARVTLMPPDAFAPEPVVLNPLSADLNRAIDESRSGSGAAPAAPAATMASAGFGHAR